MSESDGHDAMPAKAGELSAIDGVKTRTYPVARHCDWGTDSGKVDGVHEPAARTMSSAE